MALDGAQSATVQEILNLMHHFEMLEEIPGLQNLLTEQTGNAPQTDEKLNLLHQALDIGVQIKKTALLNEHTIILIEQFLLKTILYSQSHYKAEKLNAALNILTKKMQSHIEFYKGFPLTNGDNLKLYIDNYEKLLKLKENLRQLEISQNIPSPPPPPPLPSRPSNVSLLIPPSLRPLPSPLEISPLRLEPQNIPSPPPPPPPQAKSSSKDKKNILSQPTMLILDDYQVSSGIQNLKKTNPVKEIISQIKKIIAERDFKITFNPEMTIEEASLLRAQVMDQQKSQDFPLFKEMRSRAAEFHYKNSLKVAFNTQEQDKPVTSDDPKLASDFTDGEEMFEPDISAAPENSVNDETPEASSAPSLNSDGVSEASSSVPSLNSEGILKASSMPSLKKASSVPNFNSDEISTKTRRLSLS